jgi:hypothetical protein
MDEWMDGRTVRQTDRRNEANTVVAFLNFANALESCLFHNENTSDVELPVIE